MKPNKYNQQRGFSLLEIIVALAILALLLGVMMRISSAVLQNTGVTEEYQIASLIAESVLAELESDHQRMDDLSSANVTERYRWRLELKPHYETNMRSGLAEPYDVTVHVEWGEADRPRHVTLETVRLLRGK